MLHMQLFKIFLSYFHPVNRHVFVLSILGKGRNKATSPRQDKDELSSVSSSESVKLPRIEGGNQRLKTAGLRRRTSSQSGTRGDSPAYSSSNGSSGPQTFPRGKESSYSKSQFL